jgi:paraquat-inducible protein A
MDLGALLACADCDALYERPALPVGSTARCSRCGNVLLRKRHDSIGHALAFTLAGLILFVPANTFIFFSFGLQGRVQPSTITGG